MNSIDLFWKVDHQLNHSSALKDKIRNVKLLKLNVTNESIDMFIKDIHNTSYFFKTNQLILLVIAGSRATIEICWTTLCKCGNTRWPGQGIRRSRWRHLHRVLSVRQEFTIKSISNTGLLSTWQISHVCLILEFRLQWYIDGLEVPRLHHCITDSPCKYLPSLLSLVSMLFE